MKFIVVGRQPWNRADFAQILAPKGSQWRFQDDPNVILSDTETGAVPHYVFFLHWSKKVPVDLLHATECVCFHMTDVPYGRGGSPLQNLIARGHRETQLTALRMTEQFDAGPVYMKRPLSLEGGTAEEIYQRASRLACEMALEIANVQPKPQPQSGTPVVFRRRRPEQSQLPVDASTTLELFDHIRMLDADGYPPACLEVGNLRLEFSRAALYHDGIAADVRIKLTESKENPDE